MPLMPKANVIAVLISDLHLSLRQPSCRADKDWMAVQANYLEQVREEAGPYDRIPVLCAGDIFDRWNPPPELINFALKHLPPKMLCVPGQHDLPNHNISDMHRSGYGVLKRAGKITDLSQCTSGGNHQCYVHKDGDFVARGFGWDQDIESPVYESLKMPQTLHIALIHKYCWMEGKSYPDAPADANVNAFRKQLKGYDVAVFGDNHKRFMTEVGKCTVVNCGGFIRRKSDEIGRKPSMGLLHSDGTVTWKRLDTSQDLFHEGEDKRDEVAVDMKDFIDELFKLGEQGLDFVEAVKNHLRDDDIKPEVKQIILKSLEANGT